MYCDISVNDVHTQYTCIYILQLMTYICFTAACLLTAHRISLGLRHFEDLQTRIPRAEVQEIEAIVREHAER
jgi:hypothetical protein